VNLYSTYHLKKLLMDFCITRTPLEK